MLWVGCGNWKPLEEIKAFVQNKFKKNFAMALVFMAENVSLPELLL
jgi:hypothetical protein